MTRALAAAILVIAFILAVEDPAYAADAERAVLLDPGGDAPQAVRARAVRAVRDALAHQKVRVIAAADVRVRHSSADPCDPTCMLRAADASMAIGLAVWKPAPRRPHTVVAVTLVDRDGSEVGAEARVVQLSLEQAAAQALAQALVRWPTRRGVRLSVRGTPLHANVSIDGSPAGTLPFDGTVTPGRHRITVSAAGYTPTTETFIAKPGTGLPQTYHVSLETAPGSKPSALPPRGGGRVDLSARAARARTRPSAWNYALAGALFAGAVPLLRSGISTAIRHGNLKELHPNGAREEIYFGTRSAVFLGVGGALLGGSIAVLAVRPFRVEASPIERGGATLILTGEF